MSYTTKHKPYKLKGVIKIALKAWLFKSFLLLYTKGEKND